MFKVESNHSVRMAAVGNGFTLLLSIIGTVCARGINNLAQLGRGFTNGDDTHIPRPVTGIPNRDAAQNAVAQVAAGFYHAACVTVCGKLFMWGSNFSGQCGTGVEGGSVLTATSPLGALADDGVQVAFVACGGFETVAVTTDGHVIVFGDNATGQLGRGNTHQEPLPVRLTCTVLDGVHIIGCATGGRTTYLVSSDGRVFAMGSNYHGQLGLGHMHDVNTPTEIDNVHFGAPVVAVACNGNYMMALTKEGRLFVCGEGLTTPQPVVVDAFIVRIVASDKVFFVLTNEGRVFSIGRVVGVGHNNGLPNPPQIVPGVLADTTVRAIGGGSCAMGAILLTGKPPDTPGVDKPLKFEWQRRGPLLMCLLAARKTERAEGEPPAAPTPAATDVLQRMSKLPEELWKDIFKFL
jgi:alpha-tubulin suppressor-like RCC1 family protein